MKKLQILLPMAAVLLSLTGCKKDNEKSGPSGETVTFTACMDGGAKTEINGFAMTWSDDDKVIINGGTFTSSFPLGHETATFTGEVAYETDYYEAYYPCALYTGPTSNPVLPAEQTYAGNTLKDVNPMYAYQPNVNNKTLQFHNICALVKLQVTGTGTVKQIVVTSTSSLCGEFEAKPGENGKYYAKISEEGGKTLTLDCGKGGVALDPTTPKTFYIALPQGELKNLTFKCSGGAGEWTSQPVATANLTAGKLYTKSLENVEFKKPAVFSVAAGTTVTFAPGNLYWDGSAFKFETNQWDTYPTAVGQTGSSGTWSSSHVSHFLWSPDKDIAVSSTTTWVSGATSDVFFTNKTETTANPDFEVSGETAGTWRTLSRGEWNYLLGYNPDAWGQQEDYGRLNAMNLCAWVELTDVNVYGLVILPDGSDATASDVTSSDLVSSSGAVFLPAAGYREHGTDVGGVGSHGCHWSSTPDEYYEDFAFNLYFRSDVVGTDFGGRGEGLAVRLVR